MAEEDLRKCLIYYKVGWLALQARFGGERFDRLETCCEMFEKMFFNTGNQKNTSWDVSNLLDAKPGLSLLKKDGGIGLFLCGEPIRFCPWSGHAVEVQKSREVTVTQKYCYEETERSTHVQS